MESLRIALRRTHYPQHQIVPVDIRMVHREVQEEAHRLGLIP